MQAVYKRAVQFAVKVRSMMAALSALLCARPTHACLAAGGGRGGGGCRLVGPSRAGVSSHVVRPHDAAPQHAWLRVGAAQRSGVAADLHAAAAAPSGNGALIPPCALSAQREERLRTGGGSVDGRQCG